MKPNHTCYIVTSSEGKSYIGHTSIPLQDQLTQLSYKSIRGTLRLRNAIAKFGIEHFRIEVIQEGFETSEQAASAALMWIQFAGTEEPWGYNRKAQPLSKAQPRKRAQTQKKAKPNSVDKAISELKIDGAALERTVRRLPIAGRRCVHASCQRPKVDSHLCRHHQVVLIRYRALIKTTP